MSSTVIYQKELIQTVQQNLADMGIAQPPPIVVDPPSPATMIAAAADLPSD
jgi:hypothetical protein